MGFPGGSAGKEPDCNAGDLVLILGWEDPLEKGKITHSSVLACRKLHELYSPWGRKELDTTERYTLLFSILSISSFTLQIFPSPPFGSSISVLSTCHMGILFQMWFDTSKVGLLYFLLIIIIIIVYWMFILNPVPSVLHGFSHLILARASWGRISSSSSLLLHWFYRPGL